MRSTSKDVGRVAGLIARGLMTREVACDGKKYFRTYEYADLVAQKKGAEHHKVQYAYACPFCRGFHIATDHSASPSPDQ